MDALDQWCAYAGSIPLLDQVHVREAFHAREFLRGALAAAPLPDDDDAALTSADDLWADAAAAVVPLLTHGGWAERQPAAHYVHLYLKDVS